MSIIALFALATAATAPQQDAPGAVQQSVPVARLDIPNEIAPAMLPYLQCKMRSAGIELLAPGSEPTPPRAAPTGADCSRIRQQAAERAARILRDRRQGSADEQRLLIERTLAGIDGFIPASAPVQSSEGSAAPRTRTNSAPASETRVRQSLALPGELGTSVDAYLQCMLSDRNDRLLGVSTGAAARSAVERLMEDCRATRDEAEGRAREVLRTSRVPEARREALIAETLTAIDRSRDNVAEHLDRVNARRAGTENR